MRSRHRRWVLGFAVSSLAAIGLTTQPLAFAQSAPQAQILIPRASPAKPASASISSGASDRFLHVKLREGSSIRVRGDALASQGNDDMSGLTAVLARYPGVSFARLFSRPESDLAREKISIETTSHRQQADLNLYFRVSVPDGTSAKAVLDDLNAQPLVEIAYAEPLPAPAPSPAAMPMLATASFESQQGYLDVAPGGIDARYAWTQPGGIANQVRIIDVEYSWNTNHEDLAKARAAGASIANGTPKDPFADNNHGTAVLGEMIADRNGLGVTGAAYGANLNMVHSNTTGGYNLANAINVAAAHEVAGDVMIIEQQTTGPNGGCNAMTQVGCVAVEWVQAYYDAIVAATSAGIIVLEAAGNGQQNFDTIATYGNPFPAGRADSGAIIVGAGAATGSGAPARSRLSFSNYGARVDLQGWGNGVTSTGYGDLQGGVDPNVWYTSVFSGTSSATPIVTSAAAIVSSVSKQAGTTLTPAQVRAKLKSTGTAQDTTTAGALAGNIGPLPNLRAAIKTILADTTTPTTTISLTPASPNGSNGWYVSPVLAAVAASDPDDTSATIETRCVLDPASPPASFAALAPGCPQSGAGQFVPSEGQHTLDAASRDAAGNTEAIRSRSFMIDRTNPVVTYSGNAGTYTIADSVSITCLASDPPGANGTAGSGIASSTCANIVGPASSFNLGPNTFSATATDNAGNVGSGSTSFNVTVTYDSLCTVTRAFVTNSNMATAMCRVLAAAKLNDSLGVPAGKAGEIGAYKQMVNASEASHFLTPAQAAILTAAANLL